MKRREINIERPLQMLLDCEGSTLERGQVANGQGRNGETEDGGRKGERLKRRVCWLMKGALLLQCLVPWTYGTQTQPNCSAWHLQMRGKEGGVVVSRRMPSVYIISESDWC